MFLMLDRPPIEVDHDGVSENNGRLWMVEGHNDNSCPMVVPGMNCCNCGLLMEDIHIHILVKYGLGRWGVGYKACSEGCAIQIIQRGTCTTEAHHPWPDGDNRNWEPSYLWPELAEIRNRIKAQRFDDFVPEKQRELHRVRAGTTA